MDFLVSIWKSILNHIPEGIGYIIFYPVIIVALLLMSPFFILAAVWSFIFGLGVISGTQFVKKRAKELEDNFSKKEKELMDHLHHVEQNLLAKFSLKEKNLKEKENVFEKKERDLFAKFEIMKQAVNAKFPFSYVSELQADMNSILVYDNVEKELKRKSHPALKAAEEVSRLKKIYKETLMAERVASYKLGFILNKFPELEVYMDEEELNEVGKYTSILSLQEDFDRVRNYVSKEEYLTLGEVERNQLALDRYVASFKKSKWQIGRDYELFCGYIYRKDGWSVIQHGIERGLNDLGIDIIATKGLKTHIVQCKYWSKDKEIHENVICQLYGTSRMFEITHNMRFGSVIPVFITNIELSDMAKNFAKYLNVEICFWEMTDYPRIKCNLNGSQKIFHLPFDQQYDKTVISKSGEFYAWTVKEAFDAGFRRAKRWMPEKKN